MTPIFALRSLLQSDPDLAAIGTQAGLAKILGKSESLIRNVEKGRQKMTPNLARLFARKFHISEDWLLKSKVSATPIPSESGAPIDTQRLKKELMDDLDSGFSSSGGGQEITLDPAYRAIARSIGDLIEKEVLIYLQGRDESNEDPVRHLIDWVKKRESKR